MSRYVIISGYFVLAEGRRVLRVPLNYSITILDVLTLW